jgi:GT2 family glycosyltransferase
MADTQSNQLKLSVVIASWNTRDLLAQCLEGVGRFFDGIEHEVIVVDNASTDGSADLVRERFPQVRLILNPENAGPVKANNQGVRASRGEFVLILNSDAFLFDTSPVDMVHFMDANPLVGVCGPQLVSTVDGADQPSHFTFPGISDEVKNNFHFLLKLWGAVAIPADEENDTPQVVDWVPTTCFLARRRIFAEIGFFDEFYFIYCDDIDFCQRLRTQTRWQVVFYPAAQVLHVGGASDEYHAEESLKNMAGHQRLMRHGHYYYKKNHGTGRLLAVKTIELTASMLRIAVTLLRFLVPHEYRHKWLIMRLEMHRVKWNLGGMRE